MLLQEEKRVSFHTTGVTVLAKYCIREKEMTMKRLVGNPAPDFKMTAAKGDGSGFEEVSLEGYKGKWLVLFFYPRDFTFV